MPRRRIGRPARVWLRNDKLAGLLVASLFGFRASDLALGKHAGEPPALLAGLFSLRRCFIVVLVKGGDDAEQHGH